MSRDQTLATRLKSGDATVLEQIVREYGPSISGFLRVQFPILSEQDIEEIVSDVVYFAWRDRSRIDLELPRLTSWLIAIARNWTVSLLRKENRRLRGFHKVPFTSEVAEKPVQELTENSLAPAVRDVIEQLPDSDRRIVLGYLEHDGERGWAKQVAAETGMTDNAVRVRRNRLWKKIALALVLGVMGGGD